MSGPAALVSDDMVEPAESRAGVAESDVATIRAAGAVRVVIAGAATAAGAIGAGAWDRPLAELFLLVGLVWLPWTVLLVVVASRHAGPRRPVRLALYGGPLGDVAIVFAAQCLAPGGWGVFMLGNALAVSLAASLWHSRQVWALFGSSVGLTLVAQSLVPSNERVAIGLLAIFALALGGLVVVVGRIASDHRRVAESSHRFRQKAETILARVGDAIVVTDGTGVVVDCNPAGQRLMYRDRPSAVGSPCSQALGLREGERALDCRSGCPLLAGGADTQAGPGREVWRSLPDGRRQPLLATAFAVADDQGVEIVHSLRDITRLKEADEAKTLFLATASHELKTPVTVIAGFAETILRFPDMPDERRAEAVAIIHRRALELSAIVDRLLLSSKIEGGRVTVDVHPLDVRPLLVERANAIQDGTGRHVILQVAPHRLVAMADPLALGTVVDHLLDNAVKYSDGGPVVLAAHAEPESPQPESIVISVSDIGIGMDQEQADHCFDKFWQAESTDVRRFGGTGIGLYIVSSMVEAMNGQISVETAVGQGSTFAVSLPAVATKGHAGAGPDDVPDAAPAVEQPDGRAVLRAAG